MKTSFFTTGVLVASVLAAAPLSAQHAQNPLVIDSMAGPDLFQFYCAPCHGRDGRGGGPVAAVLKTPPADLTKIAERRAGTFPRADIVGFVSEGPALIPAHGTIDMPVWGPIFRGLDRSDALVKVRIANVVTYIESIQVK